MTPKKNLRFRHIRDWLSIAVMRIKLDPQNEEEPSFDFSFLLRPIAIFSISDPFSTSSSYLFFPPLPRNIPGISCFPSLFLRAAGSRAIHVGAVGGRGTSSPGWLQKLTAAFSFPGHPSLSSPLFPSWFPLPPFPPAHNIPPFSSAASAFLFRPAFVRSSTTTTVPSVGGREGSLPLFIPRADFLLSKK